MRVPSPLGWQSAAGDHGAERSVDRAVWTFRGLPSLQLAVGSGGLAMDQAPDGPGRGDQGAAEAASWPGDHGQGGAALPAAGEGGRGAWGGLAWGARRGQGSAFNCSDARGRAGRQRRREPRNRTPLLELMQSVLFLRQVQRKGKRQRKGQVVEAGRCTGSKRSFVPRQRISITDYENAGGENR